MHEDESNGNFNQNNVQNINLSHEKTENIPDNINSVMRPPMVWSLLDPPTLFSSDSSISSYGDNYSSDPNNHNMNTTNPVEYIEGDCY